MRQLLCEEMPDSRGMLTVRGAQVRHLKSVLRVRPGDMVSARLPDGTLQGMTVCRVGDDSVLLQLAECGGAGPAESGGIRLWLFQFVAKPPRMELIVRQATECGVERIIPVAGTFCQKGSLDSVQKKADGENTRWERIIREACEQSGSPVRTVVSPCVTVSEACALWSEERGRAGQQAFGVCLYERSERTRMLHEAVRDAGNVLLCALAVGAEGGIAPEEFSALCGCGFTGVHFATNILRCETAALYGIAALQSALMEKTVWQCNA